MYDGSAIGIVQLVADYLIWLDPDFTLIPRLAQSWSAEQGNKVWTFVIRKGVVFSDGTPLDARQSRRPSPVARSEGQVGGALRVDGILIAGGVSLRGADTWCSRSSGRSSTSRICVGRQLTTR